MVKNLERQESPIAWVGDSGIIRSNADASAWLYGVIPWAGALTDGVKSRDLVNNSDVLNMFFDGLAGTVNIGTMRFRNMLKAQYREFHLFTGSFPVKWRPTRSMRSSDLGRWQAESYPGMLTQRQFAIVGVRLFSGRQRNSRRKDTWLNRAMQSVDNTVFSFANGIYPDTAFIDDMENIERIMMDAGIEPMSQLDPVERTRIVDMAKTWWVSQPNSPALPVLAEAEHLHFFADIKSAMYAQRLYERGDDCKTWNVAGSMPATVFFASESDFDHTPVDSDEAMWIGKLLATNRSGGAGALAVSVRGKVEPGKVTADQLERNQASVIEEEESRRKKDRHLSSDMKKFKDRVTDAVNEYRSNEVPPTLIDLSVAVCVAGDEKQAGKALSRIKIIDFKAPVTESQQLRAFQSMGICSPIRMQPYEVLWTSTAISASGVASFAEAGDTDGAVLGWTEASRQPCYISTTTVQDKDRKPFFALLGATGSGKTMTLLHLCIQWAMTDSRSKPGTKTPVIIINPKQNADFSQAIRNYGGTAYSMSSDLADGIFDPFHVFESREEAKNTATKMLAQIIDPRGDDASWEINLSSIMDYGVKQGATCCGQALALALQEFKGENKANLPDSTERIYNDISRLVTSQQPLRLIFGTSDRVESLRVSQGLTLIDAGDYNLIPAEGDENSVLGRISQWVLRMTVSGGGAAVRGRDGIVALDEAWVALGSGAGSILEQWGRLARQWRFLPVLASQRVREFVDAGLSGFISRLLLLSLPDPDDVTDGSGNTVEISEAKAALKLAGISDKDGRLRHRMDISPQRKNGEPDWKSLQALRRKDTTDANGNIVKRGSICRGAVGYLVDNGGDPVPVVIDIAPKMFVQISTRATDVDEYKRQQEQLKREETLKEKARQEAQQLAKAE